jgi:hypothetical protein
VPHLNPVAMPKPLSIYFGKKKCSAFYVDSYFNEILEEFQKEVGEPILKIEHQTTWLTDDEQVLLTVLIQY